MNIQEMLDSTFVEFEETVEETKKCKCGGTITRRISRETQQSDMGRWFVEHCDNCDYWDCGWT